MLGQPPWHSEDNGLTEVDPKSDVSPLSCADGGTSVGPNDDRYKSGAIVRVQGGDSGRCDNFPIAAYTDGVTYAHSHAALRQSGELVVTSFRTGGPAPFHSTMGRAPKGTEYMLAEDPVTDSAPISM